MKNRKIVRTIGIILMFGSGYLIGASYLQKAEPLCYVSRAMMHKLELRPWCNMTDKDLLAFQNALEKDAEKYQKKIVLMEEDFENRKMELTQKHRVRREAIAIMEPQELTALRNSMLLNEVKQKEINEEKFWRKLGIEFWPFAPGGLGLLLIFLSLLPAPGSRAGQLKPLSGSIKRSRDETEIEARSWDTTASLGFETYDQAVKILKADDFRTCGYCQAPLQIVELGEIIEMSYFKKRPPDVSVEKRIFLGTRFLVDAVESRNCSSCGHSNRR